MLCQGYCYISHVSVTIRLNHLVYFCRLFSQERFVRVTISLVSVIDC